MKSSAGEASIEEMILRYRELYSPLVFDTLSETMGMEPQVLSLQIKPLRQEMIIAGPACTIAGAREPRTLEEYQNERVKDFAMFDGITRHSVVVIDAGKDDLCGHWGELMSAAAQARGAEGVVIDGGTRDGRLLLGMKQWPVFCRYTSPVESVTRWRPHDFDLPIAVTGTLRAQVRVNPGDWVFGDMDGVIIVPRDLALEVLRNAEGMKETEDKVRSELSLGTSLKQVFEKYRRL